MVVACQAVLILTGSFAVLSPALDVLACQLVKGKVLCAYQPHNPDWKCWSQDAWLLTLVVALYMTIVSSHA